MQEPTEIQRRVFEFIRDTVTGGSPSPTPREIAAQFGWSSKRAAECHIEALIRKGWLTSEPGKARSLRPKGTIKAVRRGVVEIPLFGSIPAGLGQDRDQETDECVPVTIDSIGFTPTRNTFALRVSGDSMNGKHICSGDIVICDHGAEPRSGQVVAALIDGKNTLKTYLLRNGKPYLKAENPKYPDLIPSTELVIQGVVKALIRRTKE